MNIFQSKYQNLSKQIFDRWSFNLLKINRTQVAKLVSPILIEPHLSQQLAGLLLTTTGLQAKAYFIREGVWGPTYLGELN